MKYTTVTADKLRRGWRLVRASSPADAEYEWSKGDPYDTWVVRNVVRTREEDGVVQVRMTRLVNRVGDQSDESNALYDNACTFVVEDRGDA